MSLSPSEQRSVLNCVPYFSKEAVVFDVGSNKGEFSDLLIDNVSEIHLFEPNELLLAYTKVKFCDRANVVYNNRAVCNKESKDVDFYYFENENNGLSSIYDNPEWDYLPKKKKTVLSCSLDEYAAFNFVKQIDFIKIDVEGAEWDVIQGAWQILKEKMVKYIQIEYSPHYKLNDYKFKDLIDFVNQFGYKVFSTDVEGLEMTVDNFVEDYRLENFIIKNMEITEDWNSEFKKNTQGLKFDFALEIGAFEGLTSTYICDNLLNEGGRMIAVDPLKDKYLTTDLSDEDKKTNKELTSMFKGQYGRFMRNTKGYPIELKRMTSREAFPDFQAFKFDFIYIDGDHRIDEVYNDGFECFKLLKVGGHLLFDDYEWRPETQEGINRFLNQFQSRYKIISKGYQVLIKKIKE
tara:strand:+ start:556 stop:1770 length:1215 start_codon:yes stop_codon:yes gene_type:complete